MPTFFVCIVAICGCSSTRSGHANRIKPDGTLPLRHKIQLGIVKESIASKDLSGYEKYRLFHKWLDYLEEQKQTDLALNVFNAGQVQEKHSLKYIAVSWAKVPMWAWQTKDGKYAGITSVYPGDKRNLALHKTGWPEWMLFEEVPPPNQKVN